MCPQIYKYLSYNNYNNILPIIQFLFIIVITHLNAHEVALLIISVITFLWSKM